MSTRHKVLVKELDTAAMNFQRPITVKLPFVEVQRGCNKYYTKDVETNLLVCKRGEKFNYERFKEMAVRRGKIKEDDEICPHCGRPLSIDEIIAITDLKKGQKALCPNCRWDLITNTEYSSKNYEVGWD